MPYIFRFYSETANIGGVVNAYTKEEAIELVTDFIKQKTGSTVTDVKVWFLADDDDFDPKHDLWYY